MAVTAAMVKELRQRTGLGMMDCKKALEVVDGDLEAAIDELRKKSALKRQPRPAALPRMACWRSRWPTIAKRPPWSRSMRLLDSLEVTLGVDFLS